LISGGDGDIEEIEMVEGDGDSEGDGDRDGDI
jgi:hypothetical protein